MNPVVNADTPQRPGTTMQVPECASLRLGRTTGILLLLASGGWVTCLLLGKVLGVWSDPNAEEHAAVAFAAYQQHSLAVSLVYDSSMMVGVLFMALAPLVYLTVARSRTEFSLLAAVFQGTAGLVSALAASRWVIMLPLFAQTYVDPQTSAATHAALDVTYQFISYFLGFTLGEQLYFILTGSWSLLLSISLLSTPGEKRWLGWLGVVAGIFFLLASFEPLNFSRDQATLFGGVFAFFLLGGILLWLVWALSLAVTLLTSRRVAQRATNSEDGGSGSTGQAVQES